jgi:hypothetical protein
VLDKIHNYTKHKCAFYVFPVRPILHSLDSEKERKNEGKKERH